LQGQFPLKRHTDDRSALALGLEWASRITTIAFEMVIPAAAGYWLDLRINVFPLFLALGAVLGFVIGLYSLLQLARPNGQKRDDRDDHPTQ
jgi:F0F1-type ATP synthase assembly protein I